MAVKKRRISTGLKMGKKTIYVGDVIRFKATEETKETFWQDPLGIALKETGFDTVYIKVGKEKWLELCLDAFVQGNNEILAEHDLIVHAAEGNKVEDFDFKNREEAPRLFNETFNDTTYFRFLLDQNMQMDKVINFRDILDRSEQFYVDAAYSIFKDKCESENNELSTNNAE
jgi:hypothetical protein